MGETTQTPAVLSKEDQAKHLKTLNDYITKHSGLNRGKPGHNPAAALRDLGVAELKTKAEKGELTKEDADRISKLPATPNTELPKVTPKPNP